MTVTLKQAQARRIVSALKRTGLDTNGLKAANPWTFEGPRSDFIREAIKNHDPELADELAGAAAPPPSLELAALSDEERADVLSLPGHLQNELMAAQPSLIDQAMAKREAALLEQWTAGAEASRQRQAQHGMDPRRQDDLEASRIRAVAQARSAAARQGIDPLTGSRRSG